MTDFVEECRNVVATAFERHMTVVPNGCHIWHGALTQDGYGSVKVRQRSMLAHRVAKIAATGEDIPWRMQVDHLCGVRACVKPEHLEVVTQTENVRRGREGKTRCPNGHEYSAENLRAATAKQGHRGCRQCDVDRNALIAFAAEALGISGAEFKRRYGQSRGAAIIAIDSAAIAGRLALIICEQEEEAHWWVRGCHDLKRERDAARASADRRRAENAALWADAAAFKAERDAARAEVAVLRGQVEPLIREHIAQQIEAGCVHGRLVRSDMQGVIVNAPHEVCYRCQHAAAIARGQS